MSKPGEESEAKTPADAEMKDAADDVAGVVVVGGGGSSSNFDIEDRRRLKHMAYVTSGCGKNREKDRIVNTFWEETWPRLAKLGWKKVEGEGGNAGSINFFPKGITEEGTTKGRDYYDRIKDVLDRLREKRTTSEGSVIEDFDAEVYRREEEENKASRKRKGGSFDGETTSGARKSAKLDSWKEGRKFTKKTSRVGPNYQPDSIPQVGEKSAVEEEPSIPFSPEGCREAGVEMSEVDRLFEGVPANKKFDTLCKLGEQGYKVDELDDIVESIPSSDGSDWDEAKRVQFSREIFKNRKDLATVCQIMNISMKTCLVYYYKVFKNSTDYRLMKTIFDDERYEKTARFETNLDVCAICDDGGELVICDECDGEYHLRCMRPPLRVVPVGRWECDECVDRKVLQLRTHLLFHSKISKDGDAKAGGEEGIGKDELLPNDETIEAVRKFGKKISQLLTPVDGEGEVEVKAEEVEIEEGV